MRRSVRDGIVTLTNIRTVYDRKGRAQEQCHIFVFSGEKRAGWKTSPCLPSMGYGARWKTGAGR